MISIIVSALDKAGSCPPINVEQLPSRRCPWACRDESECRHDKKCCPGNSGCPECVDPAPAEPVCSSPCLNGGSCVQGNCVCPLSFTGPRCETGNYPSVDDTFRVRKRHSCMHSFLLEQFY